MRGMKSFALLALSIALAACGGDDSPAKMDSGMGSGSGSGANKVVTVACTGTPKMVATTDGVNMFSPAATSIAVGEMVEFKTSATHNVIPGLAPSDPGLTVGTSADVCLKFTAAGTYNFICQFHGFKGTITVN
jgi:plastocyanin